MRFICYIILLLALPKFSIAQFDPAAGQAGSKTIYKDSNIFVAWANGGSISRGWQNIADTSLGKTTVGDSNSIIGIADNNVISLGDGGTIILTFSSPIFNGQGPDFAIFENGFNDGFLELAFVEVSSDGQNYYKFASISNNDTSLQYDNAANMNATKLSNLASKYRAGYGTPFDLEELKNMPGLNVNQIRYIKIIDAVGSLNDSFCSRDSRGYKINDPWPTPFPSSGFDLDAVGVIHDLNHTEIANLNVNKQITIYPNPANEFIAIENITTHASFEILDITGKSVMSKSNDDSNIDISILQSGIYYIRIFDDLDFYCTKLIKL